MLTDEDIAYNDNSWHNEYRSHLRRSDRMFKIGCHLSASKGFMHMGEEILSLGGNTFQYFSRNPRGGAVKALDMQDIEAFNSFAEENSIPCILCHAPYTLNPCSKDEKTRDFAYRAMTEDLERMDLTPGNMYNFHPGSHVGQGVEAGIELIVAHLDKVMRDDMKTTVLLETMAGKGSEVGSRFEEIAEIIEKTALGEKLGVCLDTCHVYDAGYDIVNDLDGVLGEFDKVIGLNRLKAIHLNDSKNPFESHKDRHEKIGEGFIGPEAFEKIINHPALRDIPFYLETPNELPGYKKEIEMLKSMSGSSK